MAARIEPVAKAPAPELVDLRRLEAEDLDSVLEEETRAWREELHWDFRKSADLVRRFVDLRALNGSALISAGNVVGYAYYVLEDHKGLVGDLYVSRRLRNPENENRLLAAALEPLMRSRRTFRVESQLMMIDGTPGRSVPCDECLTVYPRNFMLADLQQASALRPGNVRRGVYLEKWSDQYQDAAAQLIASAYVGHVDSRINDQYRSISGARRFLFNIIQYPGCGAFFKSASFAAFEILTGRMCGVSLGSVVAPEIGHITQICVAPWVRHTGVGYELLRHSLSAFQGYGCREAGLTVTAANADAVKLYESVGFQTRRVFNAYVWERP